MHSETEIKRSRFSMCNLWEHDSRIPMLPSVDWDLIIIRGDTNKKQAKFVAVLTIRFRKEY